MKKHSPDHSMPNTGDSSGLSREAELQLLFDAAQRLAQEGQTQEALVAFDRLIARDPAMPAGYYFKGLILGNLGRHEEAALSLKNALDRAPATPTILFNFALSCLHTARWQAAMLSLLRFLQYSTGRSELRAQLLLGVAASFGCGVMLFKDFDEFLAGEKLVQNQSGTGAYFIDPQDGLSTALLALAFATQGRVVEWQSCLSTLAENGEAVLITQIEPVLDDLTQWSAGHKTPAANTAPTSDGQSNSQRQT